MKYYPLLIGLLLSVSAQADLLMMDTDGKMVDVIETANGFNVVDIGGHGGVTSITRTPNGYVTLPPEGPATFTFMNGQRPDAVTDQLQIYQELEKQFQ